MTSSRPAAAAAAMTLLLPGAAPAPSTATSPAAQRQPELDAVARGAQVAAGQLLDLADAVAQRVAVAVQPPRRRLPLAVGLDERLERSHELAAVVAFPALDRRKQRVAVQPQG